jgi:hypothetical protein
MTALQTVTGTLNTLISTNPTVKYGIESGNKMEAVIGCQYI